VKSQIEICDKFKEAYDKELEIQRKQEEKIAEFFKQWAEVKSMNLGNDKTFTSKRNAILEKFYSKFHITGQGKFLQTFLKGFRKPQFFF